MMAARSGFVENLVNKIHIIEDTKIKDKNLQFLNKIKIMMIKLLIKYVHIPTGNVVDLRKQKVSYKADVGHNSSAQLKKAEAIRVGME